MNDESRPLFHLLNEPYNNGMDERDTNFASYAQLYFAESSYYCDYIRGFAKSWVLHANIFTIYLKAFINE